jgi:cell division protein FtsL
MNAAARGINQSDFFHGHLANMRLSRNLCAHMALLGAVLISALGVVYTTNVHRMALSQLEQSEQQSHQLKLQLGQLLLEQASLVTPSRVQQLATEKLHMVLPLNKQAFVLRAR